jgi:signal transduction histidine kinase
MKVKYYYSEDYLTTSIYAGVNSIEKNLHKNQYLVVLNESGEYYGLLTTNDLILRPHKLVADCVEKTQNILQTDDSIATAYDVMVVSKLHYIPVFENNIFKGILSLEKIAKAINAYYRHVDYSNLKSKQQLDLLKKKAKESDKIKEDFIRNISHEIRTPLNGLVGFSSLISQHVNTEENKRYAGYIEECSTKLVNTIENILEISEIQSDTKSIKEESCKLKNLFYEIHLYMETEKKKKGKIHISIMLKNCISEEFYLKKHADKIKQAVYHLCSNAIKFTESGTIEVGCKREDQSFILYIKDSGIGISNNDKQRIFKPFEKITDSNSFSTYPGVGLSLTIAERLVHSIGGKIIVKSVIGKGSIFSIVLPAEIISE